jgi:single-stranded-DNA-specific exonuclease
MSTISPENRYYIFEGLKEHNRHNELIKEIALANEEEMKLGHTITSYGWVIAPKINAAIRYGKEEEQINLFRAIKGEQESIEYQPRRKHKEDPKPPIEIHSLQKTMARVCNNIKQRQDTEVRKYVTKIDETIVAEKLNENSVIIINGTEIAMKNTVTGLVANKIASKYKRPVIILKSFSEEVFGGSGRNYGEGNLSNLKDFLEASNIFNKLAGHPNAFGIEIKKDKIIELTEYCNSHLSLADLITVHEVDYEILASRLKEQDVKDVAENYQIWGNSVPEPRFAITNIVIPAQEIQAYGENKNFIRFVYNGITFIKKYCSKNEYDEMTLKGRNTLGVNKKTLRMNVIGQFIMTSWEDKLIPEVKILHYDSEEWTNNNANKTATSIDDDFFF